MHEFELIATLVGGLTAALIGGYLTQRMGLSPIVGYLLGGIVIGPYTPGFVANGGIAGQFAEVGVILLMFGVGLQFHFDELLAVKRVALPGAVAQIGAATALGAVVAHAFGWPWPGAVVFGIALSVASTVVLIRVLADNHDLHTPTGHIAVGWLVVEDLFTVLVLVLLPGLFAAGSAGALGWTILMTAVKVAGLVAVIVVGGTRALPWLLDRVEATRSRELFTLAVLVVALGIAVGSAVIFGVSMALGAFLAGLVVGRSDYSLRAASDALPMRDAFAVLFFVSVGMLLDPGALLESPGFAAAALAVVLLGKPVAAVAVVLVLRYPLKVALAVAVALAQIGEFSFILAGVGTQLGILPVAATNTLVAVSIVSIFLNPLLYRTLPHVERWVANRPALDRLLNRAPIETSVAPSIVRSEAHRAVVVGYGPTGRTLTRLLRENGIEPTVIEMNVDTVRALRDEGMQAVYGDAGHRATLLEAGVPGAGNLILSAELPHTAEVTRLAHDLNPRIQVLARTPHLKGVPALRSAGAQHVFSGEGEVAMALTEAILHRLGATRDQIDRERGRVHAELIAE